MGIETVIDEPLLLFNKSTNSELKILKLEGSPGIAGILRGGYKLKGVGKLWSRAESIGMVQSTCLFVWVLQIKNAERPEEEMNEEAGLGHLAVPIYSESCLARL